MNIGSATFQLNFDNTILTRQINRICKSIWEWCAECRIQISPVYINTSKNIADKPSQNLYICSEWMLSKNHFEKIEIPLKLSPNIDSFA